MQQYTLVAVVAASLLLLGSGVRLGVQLAANETGDEPNPEGLYDKEPNYDGGLPKDVEVALSYPFEVGQPGEALIPALVPPPGFVYVFRNKEGKQLPIPQALIEGVDTHDHKWELASAWAVGDYWWKKDHSDHVDQVDVGKKIARLKSYGKSMIFGHKSVHVYDKDTDTELFTIRQDKHVLNPLSLRSSFRILPAGSKNVHDALFTINRDVIPRALKDDPVGFFPWRKSEWRIFRGQKRQDDMVYYVRRGPYRWQYMFYRSKVAYDNGESYVAHHDRGLTRGDQGLPFQLKVKPGEDSALLLACVTLFDMVEEWTDR